MRVLVIGGTRFIGPPVVDRLVAAGHDVTLFHRGSSGCDPIPAVSHIHGDRHQIDDYRADFARFIPDVVLDIDRLERVASGVDVVDVKTGAGLGVMHGLGEGVGAHEEGLVIGDDGAQV